MNQRYRTVLTFTFAVSGFGFMMGSILFKTSLNYSFLVLGTLFLFLAIALAFSDSMNHIVEFKKRIKNVSEASIFFPEKIEFNFGCYDSEKEFKEIMSDFLSWDNKKQYFYLDVRKLFYEVLYSRSLKKK